MKVFKYQQFHIQQSHAAMKVGTDSDLLGTLGVGGERILDIGTGTGVLSLMYAQRYPNARITAIEIDDNAVIDASHNFSSSKFADRIELRHISFQDYILEMKNSDEKTRFDSIICNPPYFDKSLECPDEGRCRARHSSSLPFDVLAQGVNELLTDSGVFSVCIPPEVVETFSRQCQLAGLTLNTCYQVKSLPQNPPKRFVMVYRKGTAVEPQTHTFCMRNQDYSRTAWFLDLLKDFLVLQH